MSGLRLTCASCGAAILHECGAIPDAKLTQTVAQISSDSVIAHGSKGLDLDVAPKTKVYNQGYDLDFLVFWNDYPRKRDKRKAQIAWRKSVSRLAQSTGANRADAMAQILAGANRYRNDPNRVEQFTKYAEGWLNGDGWEDEPLPARIGDRPYDNAAAILERAIGGGNGNQPGAGPRGFDAGVLPGATAS